MPAGSRTADYDFDLPPDLIAQTPAARRDDSRLMVLNRKAGTISHHRFSDFPGFLTAGDALVLNSSKVIRARLLGTRDSGASAEVMLIKSLGAGRYEAMVHPGGKLKPGRRISVSPQLEVEILETTERRTRIVQLRSDLPFDEAIERFGHIPLPPYIRRGDVVDDASRYQTVYAREPGSVAAPTAGLHFTPEVLDAIKKRDVNIAEVVLHVGAGTFKPVEVEDPAQHVMHEEWFSISNDAADVLNATRRAGGAITAVGTTAVRTLESAVSGGMLAPASGETAIFIRPGYEFKAVDRLLTNFHLPRSTLLMLVAAFAGYEFAMEAYRTAIKEKYGFYSYGDAMLIV
ncbi:MAG TPA: tRNA preQ1(34) S-adenosylmethionine ribosyltransferase-isomerase QueA [Gemmatimonadaceae bacterium]|nr:tRNA preQ1(34) S-adenosylmethionine ribosyltransferase-isomerase QueA [Gemmatimonadaceae bacterium]